MDTPIPTAWWRTPRSKALWVFGALPLLLLGIVLVARAAADSGVRVARADVTISTVRSGIFYDFVPLHGTVEPKDTVYLDALAGGQVAQLLVQAGDEIVKGQPLIIFHNEELELNVLNNAGRLVESMTQVQAYATQLENNRANNVKAIADIRYNIVSLEHTLARYDLLLKRGAVPAITVEQLRDRLNHYRTLRTVQEGTNRRQDALRLKELPGLEAQLASLQESLAATRAQLQELTVRAPVSGRITQLGLKIGENRDRGQRLAEIVPPTGFKVRAEIDEYYLGRVRVGQQGTIVLNAASYPLHVSRIYPEVKNGVFSVDLEFVHARPGDMSPGTTAEGKLSLGSYAEAVILPAGAFLDAGGGDYALVVDKSGGHAERRRIKLGRRNREQVIVLSGLRPGEQVITSGYSSFGQVQRISLTKSEGKQ